MTNNQDNIRADLVENKNKRVGEINYNNYNNKMIIIEYKNANDIDVLFEDYNYIKTKTKYGHFKNGEIRCPYDKTVFNVGYIGEGVFNTSKNGIMVKSYKLWASMLNRCYHTEHIGRMSSYRDVTVCEEWHNFQNFAKWYEENYYEIDGENMHLDKDILVKGNKIYSPQTCVFVPERINSLFIKSNKVRGKYPIGVSYHKQHKKYTSSLKAIKDKAGGYIGLFSNPTDAFNVYKQAKEEYIKEIADEYKDKIPKKLYDAMITYEVEITD